MTKTAAALARQAERLKRRRDQVLDAAQACFEREGFHSSSMSRIAAEAGMSAGHVYRYFEGKEAIVVALSQRYMDEGFSHTDSLSAAARNDRQAVIGAAMADFDNLADARKAGMIMEILAETRRSDAVAAVVANVNRRLLESARALVKPLFPLESGAPLERRITMLVMLQQSVVIRIATNPSSSRTTLRAAYKEFLQDILG